MQILTNILSDNYVYNQIYKAAELEEKNKKRSNIKCGNKYGKSKRTI